MLSSKIKDIKIRKKFIKLEKKSIILKFLFFNFFSRKNFNYNTKFLKKILTLKNKNQNLKNKIKSRCILTNRNHAVIKKFSLSRIVMKDFIQMGIIPGYTKAVW